MVLEAKTDAPQLELDQSSQAGFCKWFLSLPEVSRLSVCPSTLHAELLSQRCLHIKNLVLVFNRQMRCSGPCLHPNSSDRHYCCLSLCFVQDPQVVRFIDRKAS